MNPQENISTRLKRRAHLLDRVINNLLPNMYPCDYNSSDHFVEGILDEIRWFLVDVEELQGIESMDIENYILDYKYNELTEYFNERCIVLKNDNLQETIRRILREDSNKKLLAYQKIVDNVVTDLKYQCEELNSESEEIISFDACDFIETLTEVKVVDITRDGTVQVILKYNFLRYIDYDPFIYEFKHELKKYGNVKIDVIDSINTRDRQW